MKLKNLSFYACLNLLKKKSSKISGAFKKLNSYFFPTLTSLQFRFYMTGVKSPVFKRSLERGTMFFFPILLQSGSEIQINKGTLGSKYLKIFIIYLHFSQMRFLHLSKIQSSCSNHSQLLSIPYIPILWAKQVFFLLVFWKFQFEENFFNRWKSFLFRGKLF